MHRQKRWRWLLQTEHTAFWKQRWARLGSELLALLLPSLMRGSASMNWHPVTLRCFAFFPTVFHLFLLPLTEGLCPVPLPFLLGIIRVVTEPERVAQGVGLALS